MAKKVLLTGATGFLGKVIAKKLAGDGYAVLTLGKHDTNTFKVDLATGGFELSYPDKIDLVVHSAGKAHVVPRTELEKKEFFDVNFEGTKRLCEALSVGSICPECFVFISTVSVYGGYQAELISEDALLSGSTAYARSKILAEEFLQDWAATNQVKLTILRLPLIAGPNPSGNLGAMIKGIKSGRYFSIGRAEARKSIVWAADVARIIPTAAKTGGIFNLTDGHHPSFGELEKEMSTALGIKKVKKIPYIIAKLMALGGDLLGNRAPIDSDKLRKITSTLTFDDSKARRLLNWKSTPVLNKIKEII